jgi:hypothetical protein
VWYHEDVVVALGHLGCGRDEEIATLVVEVVVAEMVEVVAIVEVWRRRLEDDAPAVRAAWPHSA